MKFSGAIFDQNTEEIQNVFKFAMMQHNQNISSRGARLELQAYVDVINTADAFKLSRLKSAQGWTKISRENRRDSEAIFQQWTIFMS
ncbi:Glutamate receptor 1 [Eumeta japonica]|uniref:Glutamate receptor 1 n=1 Tax=Eumeta variegata TaxID=151549 RepID=A0A4C1SWE9_EUMVA|nr:Glutamate receptor 1 [Eumeta japonica]